MTYDAKGHLNPDDWNELLATIDQQIEQNMREQEAYRRMQSQTRGAA